MAMMLSEEFFKKKISPLVKDIGEQRRNFDVELLVNNAIIQAHKVVLMEASPYFKKMFSSPMFREFASKEVTLLSLDAATVEEVVDFIYTMNIEINEINVYPLMHAADFLALSPLRILLAKYLVTTLKTESCLMAWTTTHMFNYVDLNDYVLRFCLMNFHTLLDRHQYVDYPFALMFQLIISPLLSISDEGLVLKAILQWLKYSSERQVHTNVMLSYVQLHHVPVNLLWEIQNDPLLNLAPEFQRLIQEMIRDPEGYRIRYNERGTRRYSNVQSILMAIGGESDGTVLRTCECLALSCGRWRPTIPVDHVSSGPEPGGSHVIPAMSTPRNNPAVAYDLHNIYIVGGHDGTVLVNSCEQYIVGSNSWKKLPPLDRCFKDSAAVLCDGNLFVSGGRGSQMFLYLDPSAAENGRSWSLLEELPQARYGHCMIALHGLIYVLGGYIEDEATATVLRYDVIRQSWLNVEPMNMARAHFGAAIVDFCIYVIGGVANGSPLQSVERYDILKDKWTKMNDMSAPRYNFGVTIANDRIICIGGNDSIHQLTSVDRYSPMTDQWHVLPPLSMPRWGLAAATILVPMLESI